MAKLPYKLVMRPHLATIDEYIFVRRFWCNLLVIVLIQTSFSMTDSNNTNTAVDKPISRNLKLIVRSFVSNNNQNSGYIFPLSKLFTDFSRFTKDFSLNISASITRKKLWTWTGPWPIIRLVNVRSAPPRFDSTVDDFLIVIEFKWLFNLYRAWPKGPAPSGMPVCNLARYLSNAIDVASSLTVKMVEKWYKIDEEE